MINYTQLRNQIVAGLNSHLNTIIVPAENTANKPAYPYVTYKFVTLYRPESGFKHVVNESVPSADPQFDTDLQVTQYEQPHVVLSITVLSRDDITSAELACQARDWFDAIGRDYLKMYNVVTVEALAIQNRNSLLIDDYEQKYGFDVRLRVLDTVVFNRDTIEEAEVTLHPPLNS